MEVIVGHAFTPFKSIFLIRESPSVSQLNPNPSSISNFKYYINFSPKCET
jgi:hypothetical protein